MTPFTVSFQKMGIGEPFTLIAGQHFRFDIEEFERFFQAPIAARVVDLLRIASSIYVVDRLVRRRQKDQHKHWSRSLHATIGVIEPDLWSSDEVRETLTDTVEFLSDDTWDFKFVHDDKRVKKEVQRPLFPVPTDARVALYSGGLDSAAGLGNRIMQDPSRHVLPVTVWHQPIQRKIVATQFKLFQQHGDIRITPLLVKSAMKWSPEMKARFRDEPTQRSRAFLFLAAGAVAAAMVGGIAVELYESGVGAINLPLMSGMVGSRTTRSTHPAFLRRMSELIRLVVERPIAFELPFFHQTKGQVVRSAKDSGLHDLAESTVSCVHYPLRESGHKQCGFCPACIFRRQSLAIAGITEPKGTYKFDLFDDVHAANRIPKRHMKYLKTFLDQVVQLDEVKLNQPLPLKIRRHLFGTGVLTHGESTKPIERLLGEYRDEWKGIITQARDRKFSWTKLVGCPTPRMEGATHALA